MIKKYGILAYPAKHSLSPVMYNAAFKKLGIDATYEIFEIEPDKLAEFLQDIKNGKRQISGLSVSLPHKEAVIKYLDWISGDARKIGAVNTILNKDGKLSGFNTDFEGATKSLEEAMFGGNELKNKNCLKNKKIIIIGAGGACRAIAYGLLKKGAEIIILNRTVEKAEKIADDFGKLFEVGIKVGRIDEIINYDFDILIQTTSIWLTERTDTKIIPDEFFKKMQMEHKKKDKLIVMDVVYKPLMTPLLREASKYGGKIVTGDKMLLNQAITQFEILTDRKLPLETVKLALENLLKIQ